jgi:hypothetical protein
MPGIKPQARVYSPNPGGNQGCNQDCNQDCHRQVPTLAMTKKKRSLRIDKVEFKAAKKARVQTGEAAAVYAAKQLSKVEALQLSLKSEQGEGDQGPPMDVDGMEAEVIDFGRLDDHLTGEWCQQLIEAIWSDGSITKQPVGDFLMSPTTIGLLAR